jgi:hypothetical protein
MDAISAVVRIRSAFVKARGLLTPYWRAQNESSSTPSTGFCYIATEALFHMIGGLKSGFKPVYLKDGDETHWWLINDAGVILDATFDQYDETPPYHLGKKAGFMNGYTKPSKRAAALIKLAGG